MQSSRTEIFKKLMRPKRVLLVEDSKEDAEWMVTLLEENRFAVCIARDSEEALSKLEANTHDFDIIVVDLNLPGMSGLDLIKQCKRKFPQISCVLISGFANLTKIQEEINAIVAIVKPLNTDHIKMLSRLQESKHELRRA